jgi:hypothetical protein
MKNSAVSAIQLISLVFIVLNDGMAPICISGGAFFGFFRFFFVFGRFLGGFGFFLTEKWLFDL